MLKTKTYEILGSSRTLQPSTSKGFRAVWGFGSRVVNPRALKVKPEAPNPKIFLGWEETADVLMPSSFRRFLKKHRTKEGEGSAWKSQVVPLSCALEMEGGGVNLGALVS